MSKIFVDEGNNHKIDYSVADWATDQMHADYKLISGSLLKDIDWVIEDENSLLFIEYKNFDKITGQDFKNLAGADCLATEIAKKFYDSFLFLLLNGKSCNQLKYVFVLERQSADSIMRKKLRNKISKKLPFNLQSIYSKTIIDQFETLSVDEWNADPKFSKYSIKPFH